MHLTLITSFRRSPGRSRIPVPGGVHPPVRRGPGGGGGFRLCGWRRDAGRALHLTAVHRLPRGGDGALPSVKVDCSSIGLLICLICTVQYCSRQTLTQPRTHSIPDPGASTPPAFPSSPSSASSSTSISCSGSPPSRSFASPCGCLSVRKPILLVLVVYYSTCVRCMRSLQA